jgi:hypothetical protein
MPTPRRFLAPWSAEVQPNYYVVRDAIRQPKDKECVLLRSPWRTQLNRQSVRVTERRLRCESHARQFDLASYTHRRDLCRLTLVHRQKAADGDAN